ncbi:lysosomal proton-coupled steroid conjugate and bile acid symporter SLC46A3 isoform X6 [Aotus nancymaae]|uniref:lysosomal proton-coupled steroid conjugate and bile acid symporter SLC46A3 isoform X6 n=1 Tax=Aotus nancymaae TaxID=37293 RepID=UPI0030FF2F65
MKILFVEPAIFLSAFAMTLTSPLTTQYVYRRIWEETGNYTFSSDSNISECEKNKSSPIFVFQEEVQKKVSRFNLQMDISGLIPGLVSTFILLSVSDHHGRKFPMILSSIGALATSVWLCLLCYFAFPFQLLIASTFIGAFCGNYTTFWGACFAYIVDQCKEHKQKTIRIAIIDFLLGLVTGLTGLSSGYFIRELGFVWSFLIIAVSLAVNLVYILFFLGDPVRESSSQNVTMSCSEGFKDLFYRTYMLFKNPSGMAMTAFARTTLMMLLARVPFLFTIVPFSVLRSMLSKVVHSTEQGTLFACIAFLETLGGVTAVSAFNGIYSATVAWYPGFPFLLSAGLLLLPAISLCVVKCTSWNEGSYELLIQEESSEDASDR